MTVDLPAVSLSVSGPLPVSTPQALGIVGDDISAGTGSATLDSPNWVTQLAPSNGSGEFSVGARANQATGGAAASSLSTQDSAIETVSGLNDVVVMIGENDAVALAQGPQSATAQSDFVTTIVSEIEGAISNLLSGLPNTTHLIVATIPDVFVTPEVQALEPVGREPCWPTSRPCRRPTPKSPSSRSPRASRSSTCTGCTAMF